jgi:hypothetical protein
MSGAYINSLSLLTEIDAACGAAKLEGLMAEQSCPKCGNPVATHATICGTCGGLLSTFDEGPTDAAIRTAPEVPKPLAPLPPLRSGAQRAAVPSTDMVTQIEDTTISPSHAETHSGPVPSASQMTEAETAISRSHAETQSGPVPSAPPMTEAETSLIKGRLAGPVPQEEKAAEVATTPSLPSVPPLEEPRRTGELLGLPWMNPWVMGVGAMLLIALGLLIGLLLS